MAKPTLTLPMQEVLAYLHGGGVLEWEFKRKIVCAHRHGRWEPTRVRIQTLDALERHGLVTDSLTHCNEERQFSLTDAGRQVCEEQKL